MSGPEPRTGNTVLVIEDDLGLADLIQEEFLLRGWGFAHCRTGREALAWIAVHEATLALLDYSLPDMSGAELLDLVPMPPFIVTTGAGDERIAVQMMKRGALDYLVKDAHFLDTLPGLVERALHQIGTERRLAEAEASLRLAEENLKHAQKRESLGLMAGGIAHDFNNLFQSLQGNLEIARVHARDGEARPFLDRALTILGKASVLTHRMLDFSGKGFRNASLLNLNPLVEEGLGPMAALPGSGIRFEPGERLPAIEGDSGQLIQVLIGLLVNAREAQGPDGTIQVRTGVTPPDPAAGAAGVWIQPPPPGPASVWLEVQDTGSGMSQEVLDRAFDPFFTTHRPGRGLGLSAALGILRGHQAGLWVATAPGRGTTIRIVFAPALATAADRNPETLTLGGDGRRTVLLVDDDEDLQETLAEYLREGLGYHVLQARDGVEAVETFRREHAEIGVILMDATMPRMTGPDAFRAIREEFPSAKAILISGFSEEAGSQVALEGGFAEFLKKPFPLRTLEEALARALGVTR
jgi:signal transduction histidine kinase